MNDPYSYLDERARQLGAGKSLACRKAIEVILEQTKSEARKGVFEAQFSAEETLIDRVRREVTCRERKRAVKPRSPTGKRSHK